MQAWKMKPSDIYPSKKFDCIEQPPNSFHLILDNYSGWDMTFGLLSQTLQNISREARSFRDGVPPFNFDILRRPTMQLLAQGQWRPLIYPSINQTGTILPNSSISAYPPDPFVAGHGSLVYVFSHYSPPFQSILSLATTAMFCEYVIQAQLDKAHAKITDQYPSKEFYCTDDDILDSISLIYNPNAARWNFTYGNILSTLEDLTIVVAAFDNRLPYFAFEIHAKLDKLRPLVATGNWAKAKPVTGAVSIASETPSKTDRK
ncbi:uncharacterized protein KY384_006626 [Bacidia gigantensis]|uniref:uncharacterized protein n=1 Tax=Bacidia gigantensis TaxID=2732470 RepID=UPI001D0566AC|nr:uncharacterized protein KY384_006626 [Bacidia gigantensis]KAG8528937.1 hypothetical protein KY384_006626 [Bacidia gigantensis]